MNRPDGLVQRKKAPKESKNSNINDSDDEKKKYSSGEDDMDDGDCKETRLTLMEEVLLLGLKDKEVCINLLIITISVCRYSYSQ